MPRPGIGEMLANFSLGILGTIPETDAEAVQDRVQTRELDNFLAVARFPPENDAL